MDRKNTRKICVNEQRCFVKVRSIENNKEITAAMCPACWNSVNRRRQLCKELMNKGYIPVDKNDWENGVYLKGKKHSPNCPYGDK